MERQMTLEMLVNPSVAKIDETRLSRQARDIWSLFRFNERLGLMVSNTDLAGISLQYNARLNEVRHALVQTGRMIDLVRGENGVNYYKIVALEQSEFWKKIKKKGEEWKWL